MKTKLFFFAVALLVCVTLYSQNTITADNNPGVVEVPNLVYTTLQAAIDAAQNEDIIYIQPSVTTYGDVIVNKTLNLIGRSHSENNYESRVTKLDLEPNCSGSTISGLYIENRLELNNTQPTTNLVIKNNYIDALFVSGNDNGMHNSIIIGNVIRSLGDTCNTCVDFQNTTFTNNIFIRDDLSFSYTNNQFSNNIIMMQSTDNNLSIQNLAYNATTNPTNIVFDNCIIIKPVGTGAVTSLLEGVLYNNCLTYNEQSTFIALPGSNNLNDINPMFVNVDNSIFDAYTDDYHLSSGSPAINAGNDGEDIGIYNVSGYLFNLLGLTYGIPTVNITDITETVQEGEALQVTIQASSN